jgi:succinate dehydrogenase / fumarate reductase membrane anchor subunit
MFNKSSLNTPLKQARGLGGVHHGSGEWMYQRLMSIALVPLMLWFVLSALSLRGASYAAFTAWVADPIHAVLMVFTIFSVFFHAMLGVQVIVEDYIHHTMLRMVILIGNKFFFIAAAVICIFAILKIAFGG